jgi:hypothetical protein
MATSDREDDARRTGDALDRVIDEAVEATLGAGPVNLRTQVLARLDEQIDARPGWRFVVLRPALLPVAGALLLLAGVGLLWQRANLQLGRTGSRPASTSALRASVGPPGPQATSESAQTNPAVDRGPAFDSARAGEEPRHTVRAVPRTDRSTSDSILAAASLLDMDAAGGQGKAAGASVVLVDSDVDEPYLPGAPAGDLGAPVAPMPRLRPIVIQPIATPPIPEAPPVSSLGKPVSTLSDEVPRDRQDPGKSGGMCP